MTTSGSGAISERGAKAQGAFVTALRAQAVVAQRAAECGQAAECFILIRVVSSRPAPASLAQRDRDRIAEFADELAGGVFRGRKQEVPFAGGVLDQLSAEKRGHATRAERVGRFTSNGPSGLSRAHDERTGVRRLVCAGDPLRGVNDILRREEQLGAPFDFDDLRHLHVTEFADGRERRQHFPENEVVRAGVADHAARIRSAPRRSGGDESVEMAVGRVEKDPGIPPGLIAPGFGIGTARTSANRAQ